MDVIEAIHKRLPNTHLVMQGSSSVPEDLWALINELGGDIDTDLRLAETSVIRKTLASAPAEFDPRKYQKPAMDSMKAQCVGTFEAFDTAGQAARIRVRLLSEMALAY
ncbi:class II fructose-bisphosphate aldolase [Antarctobacter heliothermus]|uniref:Fructose-bisphosphate aldolase class-II n=1 Tax=Antarctobacter heliothermus TaxID=74033 RepID=A0A239CXA0_9RHOB|nr:class II fructose-bisphosphate aldolase [Antarctobacter heliothermus]SNS24865.1 Fructose-bisphosphate aldolase class-II [Antarctobacter heliothermus]